VVQRGSIRRVKSSNRRDDGGGGAAMTARVSCASVYSFDDDVDSVTMFGDDDDIQCQSDIDASAWRHRWRGDDDDDVSAMRYCQSAWREMSALGVNRYYSA
jgi:hypothetical protein